MSFDVILWYLLVGVLLVAVGTAGPFLKKVWLSNSMIYLGVGLLLGPAALGLLQVDLLDHAKPIEHLTEIAVVVSLFATGLKMRLRLRDSSWIGPALLASATMTVTVAMTTLLGYAFLGLPLGMAVLLGAVLAPTDPVLASEVQLEDPDDKDRLRLNLTGEAGLNDGTAFPFVLLAVGLVGLHVDEPLHALGDLGWKWFVVDVGWRVVGGLLVGWFGGKSLAAAAIWCRKRTRAEVGSDEMLSLGLIALVYGVALLIHTYAFLAVFAAAVAFRQTELEDNVDREGHEAVAEAEREADQARLEHTADAPEHAPALLLRDQVEVSDALEKLVQVTLVTLVGSLVLPGIFDSWTPWIVACFILFVVRPLAVYATVWRCDINSVQRGLIAWFGIRGIGTLYYLTHALGLGVLDAMPDTSRLVADICLSTITLSILLHGTSVTPLMRWYAKRK